MLHVARAHVSLNRSKGRDFVGKFSGSRFRTGSFGGLISARANDYDAPSAGDSHATFK